VFNYAVGAHNVVEDQAGYKSCTPGAGARTHTSGNDRITLRRGRNFFICSFPGHCAAGMNITVDAH
jgi:azurin